MKYVSPVCEVEVLETKDIMSGSVNVAGVTVFGGVQAVDHNNSYSFNFTETVTDPETQEETEVTRQGFSLALNYELLK